jgi:drug/metabolite transporter (DMT)-like permease
VAALTWGSGDFGGGLLVRRMPLFGVVLVSQLVGMAVSLVLAILRGESAPLPADFGWAVLGGLAGAIGISALYQGLAIGRMGIVAPITGVITALIPVLAGVVLEGLPKPLVILGIGLAFLAVILVSRVADDRAGPSGVGLALLAGIAIGGVGVAISQISDGHVFGPLTVLRASEALLIATIVIIGKRAWRPDLRLSPALAGVGILDMAGNGAFILAVQAGSLAVAAVLSSLYPVTTVVLASLLLRERITRTYGAGIALAVAGIACIAAGSS